VGPPLGGLLRDELGQAKGAWEGVRDMATGLYELAKLKAEFDDKVNDALLFAVTNPAEAAEAVAAATKKGAAAGWQAVSDKDNWLAAGDVMVNAVPGVLAVKGAVWLSDEQNRAKVGAAYDKAKAWEASLTDYERSTMKGRIKFEIAALVVPETKVTKLAKAGELAKGGEAAADGMRLMGEVKTGAREAELAGQAPSKLDELFAGIKECFTEGHPVDVASGLLFTQATDFTLPGPVPLVWTRTWFSTSTHQGALGHGWHHDYDLGLTPDADGGATLRLADGRRVVFAPPASGERSFNRRHKLELAHESTSFRVWNVRERLWYLFEAADPDGPTEQRLRAVQDANGFGIHFAYTQAGHLASITDSAGRTLRADTDAAGRLLALHAPDPEQPGATFVLVRYAYDDETGDLVTATDALGHAAHFAYEAHLMTRETFRSGLNFYFKYDGTGPAARCVHTWGDGGIYDTKLRYNSPGHTTVWDSYGHQKEYYHEWGLVIYLQDALGAVRQWRYNPYAELERVIDPLGQVTLYDYDARGNQVAAAYPDGAKVSMQFNARDLPVQGTDANGNTWQWQYDAEGKLVAETDPTEATTRYAHDTQGRVSSITDALGHIMRLRYDTQGNLAHLVAPDDSISSRTYDAMGRLVAVTDAAGNIERRHHDQLGRLIAIQLPEGTARRFAYDAEGNVVRADDGTQQVECTYTSMGQLAQRRQGGQEVQFRYDLEGRLISLLNEHGESYCFTLDAVGQVIEEVGFDGLTRCYERDAASRVSRIQRPAGRTTSYSYDKAGRVTEAMHNGTEHTRYRYRLDGALLEAATADSTVYFERDPLGRVLREVQNGQEVCSTYDEGGRRTGLTSSLGANVRFEYNALGHLRQMQTANWQSVVEHDSEGLELHRTLSGGVRTGWQRDQLGRPISQRITVGGAVRQRRYQWQSNDQLEVTDDSSNGSSTFAYDTWGNLTVATYADGEQELRQPDAVGNLFRTHDRSDRRYSKGGQLREANGTRYKYDEEGNLIQKTLPAGQQWHYTWDGAGQLSRVTRPDGYAVTFAYDALGRRVSKRFRGKTTRWVWDGDKPLHEWSELEIGPSAGSVVDLATWLFEDDSFAPAAKLTAERAYSVVCDHLGTPLSMYDGQGAIAWEMALGSYGQVRQGKGKPQDCPFRYQGQYEDTETGLYYNRYRYYDPETGCYISQDPMGLVSDYNFYAYVRNPTSWYDALGLAGNPIDKSFPRGRTTFSSSSGLTLETRAVRDLSHVKDGTLEAMAKHGFAAKDINGESIVLHHHRQQAMGPIIEMPGNKHKIGNRAQHPHGNARGLGLTAEEREAFNSWRNEYWKNRAKTELRKRGKNIC
jgi:RHS repeat-associated protein